MSKPLREYRCYVYVTDLYAVNVWAADPKDAKRAAEQRDFGIDWDQIEAGVRYEVDQVACDACLEDDQFDEHGRCSSGRQREQGEAVRDA
jgi:hypothetical protein